MSLTIGLDGSRIAKPHYTGTEHYSHAIFTHLFRVAPHHKYVIYAPKEPTHPLDTGRATVSWRIMPFPRLWTQVRLSFELATTRRPDVLFVPSHTVPLVHPATVSTVHDLGFEHFPEYYTRIERAYQRFGLWRAVKGSNRIITVSEATKQDLVATTSYPASRIHVVHHGVDRDHFHPAEINETPPQRIRRQIPYLYSIGRLEAKKQTPQLIRAFRVLVEKYGLDGSLVLAGKPGLHGYDAVQAALDELPKPIRKRITLLGYVPDSEHQLWLRFARAFVFPSGFEGFGMPVLEAMAAGVPVVTSDKSSLPEVVGDAGILVNHTRAEAIADGVRRLLANKSLIRTLIAKGKKRAATFTWEAAARKTITVLERTARESQ